MFEGLSGEEGRFPMMEEEGPGCGTWNQRERRFRRDIGINSL